MHKGKVKAQTWEIVAGARASALLEMVNKVVTEQCAEGDPRNYTVCMAVVCSNNIYRDINYESEVRRLREKGLKGRGKGTEPPRRRPQERSSSSCYDQRNADWNNYNAAAMRNEPGSSSSHQSDWYCAGSRAGWIDRNERQPRRTNWEDLSQGNDEW